MRSYSLFTIILLCVAIFLVDLLAFYSLKSITEIITYNSIRSAINISFWVFTIGLITGILVLRVKFNSISYQRQHVLVSSLYGLTVSSFVPKFIFILIIGLLQITNYVFSEEVSIIVIPIVGLFSGFLPFFVIVYAIFISLYRFKVHHIKLRFRDLPEGFRGLRMVQISDTHLGSFNARHHVFDRAVTLINRLKPDYIFFTGDLVNNYSDELRGWKPTFDKLKAKKAKYAVLGNHDYGDYSTWDSPEAKQANFDAIKKFFEDIDFKLLLNEAEVIKNGNDRIAIIGVENCGSHPFKRYGNLQKAMENVTNIPFKILLSHDPTHWDDEVIENTDISITLSGHTHGMQAGIEFGSRKWSPIQYKYKRWSGLYKHNEQYLYVNRGLGWLGFPGRLGMRPEITFIEFDT